jgi:5S rRNA maturation endonuclease (ribonuclease M5)
MAASHFGTDYDSTGAGIRKSISELITTAQALVLEKALQN